VKSEEYLICIVPYSMTCMYPCTVGEQGTNYWETRFHGDVLSNLRALWPVKNEATARECGYARRVSVLSVCEMLHIVFFLLQTKPLRLIFCPTTTVHIRFFIWASNNNNSMNVASAPIYCVYPVSTRGFIVCRTYGENWCS
jgi:hypothetical protein